MYGMHRSNPVHHVPGIGSLERFDTDVKALQSAKALARKYGFTYYVFEDLGMSSVGFYAVRMEKIGVVENAPRRLKHLATVYPTGVVQESAAYVSILQDRYKFAVQTALMHGHGWTKTASKSVYSRDNAKLLEDCRLAGLHPKDAAQKLLARTAPERLPHIATSAVQDSYKYKSAVKDVLMYAYGWTHLASERVFAKTNANLLEACRRAGESPQDAAQKLLAYMAQRAARIRLKVERRRQKMLQQLRSSR